MVSVITPVDELYAALVGVCVVCPTASILIAVFHAGSGPLGAEARG